jgi:hypothetical protein
MNFLVPITLLISILSSQALNAAKFRTVEVKRVADGQTVAVNEMMKDSLVICGTYAADFNNVEYAQRLNHYKDRLMESGVKNFHMIMNASPKSCEALSSLLDLDDSITLYSDEFGTAGKAFGVNRGFLPENEDVNPYLKLFGMLWGLGAWATLPSVIGGYIGNPYAEQTWIQDALATGTKKGRFPTNALDMQADGTVVENKFASLPVVGIWGRRPLELATLRLQNMVGVSLGNWEDLKPSEEALKRGVLTQLGGCAVYDGDGNVKFEFRDQGICNVANFNDIFDALAKE